MRQWTETANLLNLTEDHHGFYTASLKTALRQTLSDMLVEVSPCKCTEEEAAGMGWDSQPHDLVGLFNQTWLKYFEAPGEFQSWERSVLEQAYDLAGDAG